MPGPDVVLFHDRKDIRSTWKQRLVSTGFKVIETKALADATVAVGTKGPHLFVCGQSIGSDYDLLNHLRKAQDSCPGTAIIFVANQTSEDLIIRAFRSGMADYIRQPVDVEDLLASVTRLSARFQQIGEGLEHTIAQNADSKRIEDALKRPLIGDSVGMTETKSRLLRAAAADCSVLITGETGTGKELAAQLIHYASSRKERSLVSINCAAIPETLLESELLGYEKGAFTGAHWGNAGLLEQADGGTLFLDEIGEMSLVAQAKILRVIETKEFRRLGGREPIRVNTRFVAATNQNIELLVKEHKFRQDLYFRLGIVRIQLPPLRERKQDLPALLAHFVREFNKTFGRRVEGFSDASYQELTRYNWPGNIRELRNLVEAAFVNLPSDHAALITLPPEFSDEENLADTVAERDQLLHALLSTKWNKSKAAREMHWSRMTLYRKLQKYKLSHEPNDSYHVSSSVP